MNIENKKPFLALTYSLIVIHFILLLMMFFSYIWDFDTGFDTLEFYMREDSIEVIRFFIVMVAICASILALYFSKYRLALATILLPIITTFVIGVSGITFKSNSAHFNIVNYDIISYVETEHGVSITLNESRGQELYNLTVKNINKRINIYINGIFVSSPIVHEPMKSGSMFIAMSVKERLEIISTFDDNSMKN